VGTGNHALGEAVITKRGGVCNPATKVLGKATASREIQNLSDGLANPVEHRFRKR